MINPANDTLLTFGEAARRCPRVNGRPVSATTVWRWARRGLRGVRLEHVFIGRRACTTTAALTKFFNEVAQAQQPAMPRPDRHAAASGLGFHAPPPG